MLTAGQHPAVTSGATTPLQADGAAHRRWETEGPHHGLPHFSGLLDDICCACLVVFDVGMLSSHVGIKGRVRQRLIVSCRTVKVIHIEIASNLQVMACIQHLHASVASTSRAPTADLCWVPTYPGVQHIHLRKRLRKT